MGSFFTLNHVRNRQNIKNDDIKNMFNKIMAENGYELCRQDEAELTYVIKFSKNGNWFTIGSKLYETDYMKSRQDAERFAKTFWSTCIHMSVVDSDCAIMEMYDYRKAKPSTLTIGRADDYFDNDIPVPDEKIWKPLLSEGSTWEQFNEVLDGEYVFVEEGVSKLAPVIGMDTDNILVDASNVEKDDDNIYILDYKADNSGKRLTLKSAFYEIVGKKLEPYGFKVMKGCYPYIVRVINNEILHVLSCVDEMPIYPGNKGFSFNAGVATIYRKRINLDKSPKDNFCYQWLQNNTIRYYRYLTKENDKDIINKYYSYGYHTEKPETLIEVLNQCMEGIMKFVLPVLDKVNDIDSCLEYMQAFEMPCYTVKCTKICTYYPDEDESFLNFVSEKRISEHPEYLEKFLKDEDFHRWVMKEIEKRKNENMELLKQFGLIE